MFSFLNFVKMMNKFEINEKRLCCKLYIMKEFRISGKMINWRKIYIVSIVNFEFLRFIGLSIIWVDCNGL